MPILGALTLVLTHKGSGSNQPPDLTLVEPIWGGLLVVSWLVVAGLASSWFLAGTPREEEAEEAALPSREDGTS